MSWWGWVIAGAILLGAELAFVNAQFYLVFIGSAAIVVGLVSALPQGSQCGLQWALFAVLAVVLHGDCSAAAFTAICAAAWPAVHTGPPGGLITLQVDSGPR